MLAAPRLTLAISLVMPLMATGFSFAQDATPAAATPAATTTPPTNTRSRPRLRRQPTRVPLRPRLAFPAGAAATGTPAADAGATTAPADTTPAMAPPPGLPPDETSSKTAVAPN